MDTLVVLSDQQARWDDKLTERAVNKFLLDLQPDLLINNGDLFDFEALSSYRKTLEAKQSVLADVKAGRAILSRQRLACPTSRIVLVEGNHEERLTRYLLDNAEGLAEVPGLALPTFLGVADYGVEYVGPYGQGLDWHGVLVYHGSRLAPHAAYSARLEYLDAGTSGVSGHTHRLGLYAHTDRTGPHVWIESGCLCNVVGKLVPPSNRGPRVQNWQQGLVVGFYEKRQWSLYPVTISRHRFIWDRKVYEP